MLTAIASYVLLGNNAGIDLRPSVKEQIQIGKQAAEQIRKEEKVLPDSDPRVKWLRQYGTELLKQIPEKERQARPFEYTFDVIDSKEVNAFALPGGPIFFYTGLIDMMSTADQMVGVLGHEITHVRNQHWASQYADNMRRRLGLSLILMLMNANATIVDIASIVDTGAFLLPYSRKHESEADKFGYDMELAAGYNPAGMADVFKALGAGGKRSELDNMLSTHPDPTKRSEAIMARLKKEKKVLPAQRPIPFDTKAKRDAAAQAAASERIPAGKRP